MHKHSFFTGQPIFSQLLALIPRSTISRLARKHQADRYCKKFRSFDHVVTMLFGVFQQCSSLRELTTGMQAGCRRLKHLGLVHSPRRTTIADANSRRPAAFFEELFHELYRRYYNGLPDSLHGKSLSDRLFIVDASIVSLFSTVLASTGSFGLNGKKKGGIKVHALVRAKDNLPCFVRLSEGKRSDKSFMPRLTLPRHSIIVMDKGYNSYTQFRQWTQQHITWVTRLNERARFGVLQSREVSLTSRQAGVVEDTLIQLGNPATACRQPLQPARLVRYHDKDDKVYTFVTNDLQHSPVTIAALYQKRWMIETLFKRLKQNFNLCNFLGDNENAIRIQVWCTLIADLLLKLIRDRTARKWSFANLCGLVRLHLFTYIKLSHFLLHPDKALLHYNEPVPRLLLFKT